jgi:hypothetical protein
LWCRFEKEPAVKRDPEVRLAEVDRRLDELSGRVGVDVAGATLRIQRHLDLLRQREAAVRRAVDETYEESWETLADFGHAVAHAFSLIELELEIAAAAAAEELAADADAFTASLTAEVDGWDRYLERLQVDAAAMVDAERADAEDALRELRGDANVLAQILAEARSDGNNWRALRIDAIATRHKLESAIDQSAMKFE